MATKTRASNGRTHEHTDGRIDDGPGRNVNDGGVQVTSLGVKVIVIEMIMGVLWRVWMRW